MEDKKVNWDLALSQIMEAIGWLTSLFGVIFLIATNTTPAEFAALVCMGYLVVWIFVLLFVRLKNA